VWVEARFRTLQIIWAALMMGVAMYAVVAYGIITFGDTTLGLLPARLLTFAAPLAALGMIGGAILRRRFIEAIPRGLSPEQRLEKYMVANIQGLAVIEGLGLLLITLSLAAGAGTWALVGGGLAIGVMALSGPRREEAGLGR
jgi:hypothetical protein